MTGKRPTRQSENLCLIFVVPNFTQIEILMRKLGEKNYFTPKGGYDFSM